MMAGDSLPKLGIILTLADLYRQSRPELPEQFGSMWRQRIDALFDEVADVHFAPVAHTAEEFSSAVDECHRAMCIALIIWPMAYAPSGAVLPAAQRTGLPLIIVSSARDASLPYDMTADHMLANQAVHGAIDLTNALWRAGRDYHLVAGHPSDQRFREDLRKAVQASHGAHVLRNGRVGQIGSFFAGMLDFTFDPRVLAERLGFETVPITPETLINEAGSVESARVDAESCRLHELFEMDPSLTNEELDWSLRYSCALEDLARDERLDAVAMNFGPVLQAGAASLPFLGADLLMARGIGYAGEGDVLGAMMTTALARVAGQATFTELYAPDYQRGEVLLSHMGECNIGMADPQKRIRLMARPFPWGKCHRTAVPVFQLRPGKVTLASISQSPDARPGGRVGFQLLAITGEIVAAPEHANLCSPYTRIRFGDDLPEFVQSYSRSGGTHHLALAHGDLIDELKVLSHLVGLDFRTLQQASM